MTTEFKTVYREVWSIDKEPTHLNKEGYNLVSYDYDGDVFLEHWAESDNSLGMRIIESNRDYKP